MSRSSEELCEIIRSAIQDADDLNAFRFYIENVSFFYENPFRAEVPSRYFFWPVEDPTELILFITPYQVTFERFVLTYEEIENHTWTWQRNDPNGYRDPFGGVTFVP